MAFLQTHTRSISLPSRLIHPTNFESKLQKIKSLPIICSFSSEEEIQSGLVELAELYNSVQFSAISQDAKSVEESLSGSLQLLDSCSAIRELLQMMKENVHTLQSALRRKGTEYSTVQNDVAAYFSCRKRMNKLVAKNLKKLKSTLENPMIFNGEQLTGVTVAVFKSILVFLSGPTLVAASRWSLVSKMVAGKSARQNDQGDVVGSLEFALRCLHGKMRSSGNGGATAVDVQSIHKKLQNVDAVVEGFDGGLERLFRQLIQNRVALLNIITNH